MTKEEKLIIPAFVLALIIIGAASLPFFVDAQSLEAQIIAQLETQLQRKVSVQGAKVTILTGPVWAG
jgi:hypothetical protein